MPKYVTKAAARFYIADDNEYGWSSGRDTIDVIVEESMPKETGLLDSSGEKLYRMPEKRTAGFYPLSEET